MSFQLWLKIPLGFPFPQRILKDTRFDDVADIITQAGDCNKCFYNTLFVGIVIFLTVYGIFIFLAIIGIVIFLTV
ncbi:hypothetical protein [uncultured Mobiluncus sp.]|mgnify:FL=1|uniref:hypothetical protein n=1 Tax=uncultured Mobiluncus sp. TaxID=293425 RepID=UPI0025D0249C|nr:hypothetical protein [uncultured Mobiluncus sp.]